MRMSAAESIIEQVIEGKKLSKKDVKGEWLSYVKITFMRGKLDSDGKVIDGKKTSDIIASSALGMYLKNINHDNIISMEYVKTPRG